MKTHSSRPAPTIAPTNTTTSNRPARLVVVADPVPLRVEPPRDVTGDFELFRARRRQQWGAPPLPPTSDATLVPLVRERLVDRNLQDVVDAAIVQRPASRFWPEKAWGWLTFGGLALLGAAVGAAALTGIGALVR